MAASRSSCYSRAVGVRVYRSLTDAKRAPGKVRRIYLLRAHGVMPDFAMFPNLEELTLFDLRDTTSFPKVFECTKLRSLTITRSQIRRIPPGFARLTDLEALSLVGNRLLTTLPADLSELPRLRRLVVDHNQLTSLPASIGKLRALTELIAYNNAIAVLPTSLYKLDGLRWLELQCNKLRRKPSKLMTMRLRHLLTDFEDCCRSSRA